MLYEYCQERSIPHKRIGKIIVATSEEQLQKDIPALHSKAEASGVMDLKLLSLADIRQLEPEINCVGGLFSPSTGIIDSHTYIISLLADAENSGATLALNSTVQGGQIVPGKGIILDVDGMELSCDVVVNCAGLHAHQISNKIIYSEHPPQSGRLSSVVSDLAAKYANAFTWNQPRQYFAKGNYFKLEGQKSPFSHLIYPVPQRGGLGVHATLDLSGNCRFGPDVEWIPLDVTSPDSINLSVNMERGHAFYDKIQTYWPTLLQGSLVADYSGVRPKLGHPDLKNSHSVDADFVLEGPSIHGIDCFVNMFGMESPGLTSSLAIANKAADMALCQD